MAVVRTPRDFDALVEESAAHGIDPVSVATILYWESALNPAMAHPHVDAKGVDKGAYGANAMQVPNLRGIGLTSDQWIKLPLESQLPAIFRFWMAIARTFNAGKFPSDAAHLYALNYLPARYRDRGAATNDEAVLASAGEEYYDDNPTLDPHRTGVITIATLRDRLALVPASGGADWRSVAAGIDAAKARAAGGTSGGGGGAPDPNGPPTRPSPLPPPPTCSRGIAVLGAVGAALIAYAVMR